MGAAWDGLFDSGEMDAAVAAVRAADEAVRAGARSAMSKPLNQYLLAPLGAYVEAHLRRGIQQAEDVIAARRLREIAEAIVEHLELRQPLPAECSADAFYAAWLGFRAVANRGQLEVAEAEAVKAALQAARQKEGAAQAQRIAAAKRFRGRAASLSVELFVAWLNERGARALTEQLAAELAKQYKVGVRTVQRRQAEARAAGLLS